jgi:uncharacterized Zn finger protein
MTRNRNRTVKKFIGMLSSVVVHDVLLQRTIDKNLRDWYEKEIENNLNLANRARIIINPVYRPLPCRDQDLIRTNMLRRATATLKNREQKDYKNIDISLVEPTIEKYLKETNVI